MTTLPKLTNDQLRNACCYLQGRLETAMTLGHTTARDCLVNAIGAIIELEGLRKKLPSCPGIEIEKGHYSGCGGGEDCPTCKGKW